MNKKECRYKNRREGVCQAMTDGLQQAQELGLGESYQNWTPLEWYCYLVGLFGGLLFSLISNAFLIMYYLLLIK